MISPKYRRGEQMCQGNKIQGRLKIFNESYGVAL